MTAAVNNGVRKNAVLNNYEGVVGVTTIRGAMVVSYRPNKPGKVKPGDIFSIDGVPHKVRDYNSSHWVPGMVLVTAEEVNAGGE